MTLQRGRHADVTLAFLLAHKQTVSGDNEVFREREERMPAAVVYGNDYAKVTAFPAF
jgi:hypothetical protein